MVVERRRGKEQKDCDVSQTATEDEVIKRKSSTFIAVPFEQLTTKNRFEEVVLLFAHRTTRMLMTKKCSTSLLFMFLHHHHPKHILSNNHHNCNNYKSFRSFVRRPGGSAAASSIMSMSSTSTTPATTSDSSSSGTTNDGGQQQQQATATEEREGSQVQESTIRLMTRLAIEHDAVNLSQGFPNEPPPSILRLKCALAILQGQPPDTTTTTSNSNDEQQQLEKSIIELLSSSSSSSPSSSEGGEHLDQLNQYSPPMGRPDLRAGIAEYYQRFYKYDVSPEDITVTLGATEAFASALRSTCQPGDKVVIIEPFHELYPSQAKIFYLDPVFVPLRPSESAPSNSSKSQSKPQQQQWYFDLQELEQAMIGAKALLLNSPHNPTGKVFTRQELKDIVDLCLKHDVYLITDEIYEHILWQNLHGDDDDDAGDIGTDGENETVQHYLIPKEFPEIREKTLVCNSLGKSASATGWRVGWCLHPSHLSHTYRGIHDQLAVMSPHPMQYATMSYLTLPDSYFTSLSEKYRSRVQRLAKTLKNLGFGVVDPQGAYYLFVNYKNVPQLSKLTSLEAAMFLLKDVGVACVPGDNFYGSPSDDTTNCYLRFAACRSDGDLDMAIQKLEQHLG